ncbi:MAG: Ig-like domain-containing protein [Cyclobacteriaceae bacterium]
MYNLIKKWPVLMLISLGLFIIDANGQIVEVWLTTADQTSKLSQQANETFGASGSSGININIDPSISYQTMDGFGASMTGSSAYLFQSELNSTLRNELMDDLFTSSGINLSMVRHSIGASDFNLSSYTYNDLSPGQTDPSLANFSLGHDLNYLVPTLQQVLAVNSSVKIMGSPWSSPAWMKEVHALNGGWLDVQWYQTYADYLVKYIQEYSTQGLDVWAITIQNEPLHETSSYPSMRMDAGNQISFLKNNLGPAMANAGLNTGVIIYDHNWDRPDFPIEVLNDPQARNYTIGTGFHAYAGNVSAQSDVHNAHPDKGIWFTEITGQNNGSYFGVDLTWTMRNVIIGATRNWAKGLLMWNLALDENDGPTNGGCSDCRGIVTINTNTGDYIREVEYYALGHVSKFVDVGAVRIESTYDNGIQNVAFQNSDGSIVLIVSNTLKKPSTTFTVTFNGQSFDYSLPKESAATFKWMAGPVGNQAPVVSITAPSNGSTFNDGTNVTISADATDADGSVDNVEFFVNGNSIGTDTTYPFSMNWTIGVGAYALSAVATDNESASTTSSTVNITGRGTGSATDVYVNSIVTGTQSAGQGNKHATATVTVFDNIGNPAENAAVTGTFSGTFSETISGTTGLNGNVILVTVGKAKGSVLVDLCVDNVTHGTLTYNNSLNVITCTGSSARISGTEEATQEKNEGESDVKIHPHPFRTEFIVNISLERATTFKATLMSLDGKVIDTLYEDDLTGGLHMIKIAMKSFKSGMYFLQTEMNGKKEIHRLLKVE